MLDELELPVGIFRDVSFQYQPTEIFVDGDLLLGWLRSLLLACLAGVGGGSACFRLRLCRGWGGLGRAGLCLGFGCSSSFSRGGGSFSRGSSAFYWATSSF